MRTLSDRLYFANKRNTENHQAFINKYQEKIHEIAARRQEMIEKKNAWFKKMEELCENAKIVFAHQIEEEVASA